MLLRLHGPVCVLPVAFVFLFLYFLSRFLFPEQYCFLFLLAVSSLLVQKLHVLLLDGRDFQVLPDIPFHRFSLMAQEPYAV